MSAVFIFNPASGSTFGAGETITITVAFSPNVRVVGRLQLALQIGSATRRAIASRGYTGAGSIQSVQFQYVVQATDTDTDGISIGANALTLNGGTIQGFSSGVNAALGLGSHAVTNSANHKVNGAATVPAVNAVTIASRPASGAAYGAGERIAVQVGFQIPVTVTGSPQLALTIGTVTRQAGYASGSGTRTLTFHYTVLATDADSNGISIGANALALNGGTIQSGAGTNATLSLGTRAIADAASHQVDGSSATAPAVNAVTVSSTPVSGSTYGAGERITVQVGFVIPVAATGTPQVALTIGTVTRQAGYASGSGTTALTFAYTVQAADSDSDGLSIGASALALNGGTIQSLTGTNATLGLGSHAIANAADHQVDGSSATTPTVSSVTLSSSPASGDTYGAGETIEVEVGFQIAVTVTGTPQLALTIGTSTGQAAYASGSGTTTLTFQYTVLATDADSDGLSVAASALALNGGTIQSAAMTNATLALGTHALANQANHKVNGAATVPTVSSVTVSSSPASAMTYGAGETIEVQVGFQIAVTVTGTPQLALTIGTGTGQADYASGSGTSTLTFRYTVRAADADSDGLSVAASALALNGGTIQSAAMTNAALGLGTHALANQANHKVNGAATVPTVSSVTVSSSPASAMTYGAGETIAVQVGFQIAVTVTGTPQLALTIGAGTGQADYASGSGTTTLTFQYTVLATDADSNGLSVAASALALNGGTIQSAAMTNATLGLGAHALANQANHRVNGAATAPTVSSVTISSSPASGMTYGAAETIAVQVGFQIPVTVTGTPQLALTIGAGTGQADYASGSGTATLTFRYTVLATDADSNGLSVGASALALNGGTIQSAAMTNAALGLGAHALANQANHRVNGAATVPTVSSVTLSSSPASAMTYGAGETIEVQVGFQVPVTVTGTPQLALTLGTGTGQADYASGSGTATLTFRYTVRATDADSDGLSIGASALALNSGAIQSAATTNAALGLGTHALASQANHKVNGAATAPAVSSVTLSSSPASAMTYGAGETIAVQVGFQIPVTVTGTPQLALTIGTGTGQADYASGTGTTMLTFRYTVRATDADSDGLSIGASALALNGGTIQSAATTNAALGLGTHALANQANHKVDGSATVPTVTAVTLSSSPANGDTYGAGERIEVEVGFQIPVTVTGTPQLALTIGSATAQADYASGTGTQTLTFRYTVQATDADSDGVSIGASALALNSGTLQSAAMTNATLGLGTHALANQANHKVNGSVTVPTVSAVTLSSSPASGDTYGAGETIAVQVRFQIPVTVTGTPQLALTLGTATAQADYASGSGTATLTFRYTVQATDADSDGLSIGANALALNSGALQSAAMTNAALALGTHALANQANHKVNGAATAPTVTSVTLSSSPASADTYGAGETIAVQVGFQIPVTVTGTPQLALTLGSATAQADYASGSGTATLTFRYTVRATDADSDGLSIGASALALNSGAIQSSAMTNAALGLGTHALANQTNHKVNGAATVPTVSAVTISSSPASGDTYGAGETIAVQVGFQIPVTVTGTPQLALTLGSATAQADYASGSGTATLTFRYTVLATDADSDGLSIGASALALNSGTLQSAAMTNATLGLGTHALANQANHKVDGSIAVPTVTTVTLSSSPASGDTYGAGETIAVQVGFLVAVTVTGTPQLALTLGTGTGQADYASGSGTQTLTFRYTVQATDTDSDGLSIGTNALALNGGTLQSGTGANAALGLGTRALANQANHKVNGAATMPAVTSVTLSSRPANGDTYGAGEAITVAVGFQIPVTVTGTPQLALTIGTGTRQADYTSGSGTQTLTFRYTVHAADADSDGLSVGTSALTLNSGTIQSAATTNAALGLGTHAIANAANHKVDGSATVPTVSAVTLSSRPASGEAYGAGEVIAVQVAFSAAVTVTGTPRVALRLGSGTVWASYARGSGTATLIFHYTVRAADRAAEGLAIEANALALNGGTIQSGLGANVGLSLGGRVSPEVALQRVDGTLAEEETDQLPVFAEELKLADRRYQVGTPIPALQLPAAKGGDGALTYFLEPALPAGLAFDAATRAVTGMPTVAQEETRYRYQVQDEDGDRDSRYFTLFVAPDLQPSFPVTVETQRYRRGAPIEPLVLPAAAGGDGPLTYRLEPALPRGLAFDAAARTVAGTPHVTQASTWYTLTVLDADGDPAALRFALGVGGPARPSFGDVRVAAQRFRQAVAIEPLALPTAKGGDGELTYRLEPALPPGLAFEAATGRVTGAPQAAAAEAVYTLTAADEDGDEATLAFRLTVAANPRPDFGGARVEAQRYRQYAAIEALPLPSAWGGDGALTYALTPALPTGLAFDAARRTVTGTPVAPVDETVYTLTARDADGDAGTLAFEVSVAANARPSFGGARVAAQVYRTGVAVPAWVLPAAAGGDGELTYALEPGLPTGLAFQAATRQVAGTPMAAAPEAAYTLTATDADGDAASLAFQVVVEANARPSFGEARVGAQRYRVGEPIGEVQLPAATGGNGSLTYMLAPALPAGLAFDAADRLVTGTPTAAVAEALYTLTAQDEDGDGATLDFTVEVREGRGQTRARALGVALAAFGRTSASEAVEVIGERFEGAREADRRVNLGGQDLPLGAGSAAGVWEGAVGFAGLAGHRVPTEHDRSVRIVGGLYGEAAYGDSRFGASGVGAPDLRFQARPVGSRASALDLLARSSFAWRLGQADEEGAPRGLRVWGRGGLTHFGGQSAADLRTDGEVRSGYAGVDYRVRPDVLLGLAAARTVGDVGYELAESGGDLGEGAVDLAMTSVLPYAHWAPRPGLGLWGLAGFGRGTATLEDEGGSVRTQFGLLLGAFGGRQRLTRWTSGELAVKADLFQVGLDAEARNGLQAATGTARRGRVLLEGRGDWTLTPDLRLRPLVEFGGRWDGGTAETGAGTEVGGGLELLHARGVSVEARGRYLLAHQAAEFREWGASATVRVGGGVDRRGFWLALTPAWGVPSSGVGAMWSHHQQGLPGTGGLAPRSQRLGLEFGHGPGKSVGVTTDRRVRENGSTTRSLMFRGQFGW